MVSQDVSGGARLGIVQWYGGSQGMRGCDWTVFYAVDSENRIEQRTEEKR